MVIRKKTIACILTISLMISCSIQYIVADDDAIASEAVQSPTDVEENLAQPFQFSNKVQDQFTAVTTSSRLKALVNIEDTNIDEHACVNVELPTELPFTIDSYEINGKGQLYSEKFTIRNKSHYDIKVSIASIFYKFSQPSECISVAEPFGEKQYAGKKEIYMALKTDEPAPRIYSITDQDQNLDMEYTLKAPVFDENGNGLSVEGESSISFYFEGNVTLDSPDHPWREGDVKLHVVFDVAPIVPIVEETDTNTSVLPVLAENAPNGTAQTQSNIAADEAGLVDSEHNEIEVEESSNNQSSNPSAMADDGQSQDNTTHSDASDINTSDSNASDSSASDSSVSESGSE